MKVHIVLLVATPFSMMMGILIRFGFGLLTRVVYAVVKITFGMFERLLTLTGTTAACWFKQSSQPVKTEPGFHEFKKAAPTVMLSARLMAKIRLRCSIMSVLRE